MEIPQPPRATKKLELLTAHDDTREDPFYWLRERSSEEVLAYLQAENAYTDAVMADTERAQAELFAEMKGRIQETDTSAPVRKDEYYYYSRTEAGKQYPIYCRKKGTLDAPEELLLDQNELAGGNTSLSLGTYRVSPDHTLLAYATNGDGSERFTLRVKDLATGALLPDVIEGTRYSFAWKNDSRTFLYTTVDETLRPDTVHEHTLGEEQRQDRVVYHEPDGRYFLELSKSRSGKYIFIELESKVTREVRLIDADVAGSEPRLFAARVEGHEYHVAHHTDSFFVLSNDRAKNFRLLRTAETSTAKKDWYEIIPGREDVTLEAVSAFERHLVVYERQGAVRRVRVRNIETGDEHYVEFPEAVYAVEEGDNKEFCSGRLRFVYSSLVTPPCVYDYDMDERTRTLVKSTEVGGYHTAEYVTERVYAEASDGTRVPISLAYKKGVQRDGSAPMWLTGYGSYGHTLSPSFAEHRVSLLDRGFVFAIAHVRGGGACGRRWYEDGKYRNKQNTFTDFIACAEHLVREGYAASDKLVIVGRSAGGLLMGAVLNMRPDLFTAAIADVPFVDVVTTMLDPSIPLTVSEYEEWGNPNDETYYAYMRAYSPYDNVSAQPYPHILVTAGLNDTRVQYWEPAKWVARLREMKTDDNLLLLRTRMQQGHLGAAGRYESLKEVAFEYAFACKVLGVVV